MTKVENNSFTTNTKQISIDSFRISIPINLVEIIDSNLTDKVTSLTINAQTNEVLTEREVKENSITKSINNVPFRFNIDNSFNEKKVVILLNSKQLFEDYFSGITESNIRTLYNRIIECKVINIDFDVFIKQPIVDVDFKRDNVTGLDEYHKALEIIRNCSKLSKYKDDGCHTYSNGIEFSVRKTSKYLSNPYFKIYHKEIELKENSSEFTKKHLKGINFENLVRFEFTIKNKKHFNSFGVNSNTLEFILRLSDEVKEKMLSSIVKKHLSSREMIKPTKNDNLNPNQQIMFDYINVLLEKGLNIDMAMNYILGSFSGVTKHRKKKEITFIYENYLMGTIAEKRSVKMNNFFDNLGWF
jgi:hypothetical protein